MPRRTVPFLPNQYYHLYNRGNNRQPVFFERDNYLYFLYGIKKYLCEFVEILAYCLMPTHYHILVRVLPHLRQHTSEVFPLATSPTAQLSQSKTFSLAMQKFGISYTKAINKRFNRVGALFQGQFNGKPVTSFAYLLNLCIYIHANPVKNCLADLPEDWEFSNYLEWMNLRNGTLVNREFIEENFGSSQMYQKLVMEYVKTRSLPMKDFRSLRDFGSLD